MALLFPHTQLPWLCVLGEVLWVLRVLRFCGFCPLSLNHPPRPTHNSRMEARPGTWSACGEDSGGSCRHGGTPSLVGPLPYITFHLWALGQVGEKGS